jgi:hypothetical protein
MIARLASGCFGLALGAIALAATPSWTAAASDCIGSDFTEGVDASAREAKCLKELRASASRHRDVLVLRFDNGATKRWHSNPKACADDNAKDCVAYFLIGYHPLARVYAIGAQYYEGAGTDIVAARDGQTLSVHGIRISRRMGRPSSC